MSNTLLCICEGAPQPNIVFDKTIHLSHLGTNANIRLGIEDYYNNLAGKLDDISKDLLRIAAYIYVADTSVSRGGDADIWGKNWRRQFHLAIPVLLPDIWNDSTVKDLLKSVVDFLTEDSFEFTFTQWQDPIRQTFLNLFKTPNEGIGADSVVLFSGGLDSLYAVGKLTVTEKRRPLLISHLSTNKVVSRQRSIIQAIKNHHKSSTDWSFPHWAVRISRMRSEGKERTQRSRSFLYATLGVTAAHALNVSDVFLSDNGIVSINLPPSSQTVGAMASRTTHPKFISNFNTLMEKIGLPKVKNSLLHLTKAEVVSGLRNIGFDNLIPLTVSCARIHGMSKFQPHCGTCTQCLDRRFATIYANLEAQDPPEQYVKDIFKDSIDTLYDRMHAENLIRHCINLRTLSIESFLEIFPMVWDCVDLFDNPEEKIQELYDLHQRYSEQVLQAIKIKQGELFNDFVSGIISRESILGLIGSGDHLKTSIDRIATELGDLFARRLPIVFQTKKPARERDVQDAAQALLSEFSENIQREAPQVSYSVVNRRPDFSKDRSQLFIEMKLVKAKKDVSKVIDEISADIRPYLDHSRGILFCIYDTDRNIVDDDKFKEPFKNDTNVFIKIIR
jgi:hypothetical protein